MPDRLPIDCQLRVCAVHRFAQRPIPKTDMQCRPSYARASYRRRLAFPCLGLLGVGIRFAALRRQIRAPIQVSPYRRPPMEWRHADRTGAASEADRRIEAGSQGARADLVGTQLIGSYVIGSYSIGPYLTGSIRILAMSCSCSFLLNAPSAVGC